MATKKTAAQIAAEKKAREVADKKKADATTSAKGKADNSATEAARQKLLSEGIDNPSPEQLKAETDIQMGDALKSGEALSDKYINPDAFKHIDESRTGEETDTLAMLKAEQERSGTRTADAALALDKFKGALGGLDSQEGQALKETARRQLDSQFQTQMSQAKVAQARSGTRGGAGAAQSAVLQRDRARSQSGLESDLAVQNIGIKNQALQNFGGFVNTLDASEAARRQAASGMYAGQINAQTERDLGKTQFNIGQDQSQAQARLQAVLGGANIYSATYGNNLSNNLAFQNMQKTLGLQQEQMRQSAEANAVYANSLKAYGSGSGGNKPAAVSAPGTSDPNTPAATPGQPKKSTATTPKVVAPVKKVTSSRR